MTLAGRIDRAFHVSIDRTPEVAPADAGERHALLCERRRQDAVEHVDAAMHSLEQIASRADAHQIPRFVRRQQLAYRRRAVLALRCGFADGETADGVPVERQLCDGTRALDAQVHETRALHDTEKGLRGIAARLETALRPAVRELHRIARDRMLDSRGHAMIEHHHDVGADGSLRGDAALRTQAHQGLVRITLELGVILAHGAPARQREYLEAAGVGNHRTRPVHEAVNTAELLENLYARAQK